MSEFAFNINHTIKVKLTDKGKEILDNTVKLNLEKFHLSEDCNPYIGREDANGYMEFQLWDFMNIFGPHMFCGAPCYIENNEIIFDVEGMPTEGLDEWFEEEKYDLYESSPEEYSYKAGWNTALKRGAILARMWVEKHQGGKE